MKQLLFFIALVCFGFTITAQTHSVLSEGNWVKLSTDSAGIYRLTYYDLQSFGVDVSNLSSDHLNLYGMAAGAMDEMYDVDFTYDLQKMAILVDDSNDGTFDAGDFLLFYGQGPVTWNYNADSTGFKHTTNPYCNKVYYYLRTDDTNPKRVQMVDYSTQTPTDTITELTYTILHEKELYNPLHSGRWWMGELFKDTTERTFTINNPGSNFTEGTLNLSLGSNSTAPSTVEVYVNNQIIDTIQNLITPNGYYAYRLRNYTFNLNNLTNPFDLKLVFNQPNDSAFVYLDYFELNLNTSLSIPDPIKTTEIRSTQTHAEGVFLYRLTNTQSFNFVWDVTDPLNVSSMKINRSGDTLSFIDTRTGRNYLLYNYAPMYVTRRDDGSKKTIYIVGDINLPEPTLEGEVENQDIIGTATPNMMIITTNDLQDAANKLATFHTDTDGLSVGIFKVNQIYNEFSAGRLDPTAIRNFIAQKYNQGKSNNNLQYVLLLGPASFDYRGILYPNIHQVPTYESIESGNLINAYGTDTYLTTLDNTFLPVGRIPVSTSEEAYEVVNKIIDYKTQPMLTNWKNKVVMMADNGEFGYFSQDADYISQTILDTSFNMNQTKLYFSLWPPVNNGYPQVKQKLLNLLDSGVFYMNYMGYGGAEMLSKEGVFKVEDAQNLENQQRLPLWINASGGTARFDDPEQISLCTALLLNPNGGAIAALGNSAPNYASANFNFNYAFASYLFSNENRDKAFGDAYAYSINHLNSNLTKWSFIGDPALKPGWPQHHVITTNINGEEATQYTDTILPGSLLTLEGYIEDNTGNVVTGFNGKVRATVYDMPYIKETIEGEYDPVKEITLYDSILSMNCLDVDNGHFIGNVRLPANEHLNYGNIKISYYCQNGSEDATGNQAQLIYGGKPNSLNENPAMAGLKAYPSPFGNNLKLLIPAHLVKQHLSIMLTDVTGKAVYRNQINANNASDEFSMNLPDLPQGLYLLNVTGTKGNKVFKLMHQ